MADPRSFIKIHDNIEENPKVEALSDKAFRHLIGLWCYCSRNWTDGKVSGATMRRKTTPATLRNLIDAGLVERDGDDYQMHDYLEHQRSRAAMEELSAARAAAGKRGGEAKAKGLASAKQPASKSVAERERERNTPLPPLRVASPSDATGSSADADRDRDSSPSFDDFWQAYPRQDGQAKARSAWNHAIRAGADTTAILGGLQRNLDRLTAVTEPRFIPTATTWLRDERWTDQGPPSPPSDPDSPWRADLYLPPPGPGEREVDEGSENAP